jgi:hypothetical protein
VNDDGSLEVWINRGVADTSMGIDGVRFADVDGDGVGLLMSSSHGKMLIVSQADNYIWLHPDSGAPTV